MSVRTTNGIELEVFYDGGCPLCVREMDMLRNWDRDGRIQFTDIDARDFDATRLGKTQDQLMQKMHGRLPDGTWIHGVEVFRRMYTAVGYASIVWMTRLPLISQLLDLGYLIFARNRLRLTGRCKEGQCEVRSASGKSHQKSC